MYITEYKKALRDAGFDGLRIVSFEHEKGIFQGDKIDKDILDFSPKFFITLINSVIIGDIINILAYKLRPYEVEKGSVDEAMDECREIILELDRDELTDDEIEEILSELIDSKSN